MNDNNTINNTRRIEGPTPKGGAYAILYFYDNNDNPVNEENAEKAYGVEFDKEGNRICTTYFNFTDNKDNENIEDTDEFEDTVELPRIG